ncbi:AzlC family ABC transporter permease [Streptococcus sp. S784/96/1]|uniref:AzlC family ABC transporter permease n=1 Tax=Streptococcus sp. S784/96/1 TaxID=2653499 RepID=UPI001389F5F7|nr:AzlC family ABC transporter permease [Streptococcus sp. S784/96/1]
MKGQDLRLGVRAAIPTMLGYLSIGIAFGIVASETGLTPMETLLTSLLIYSGSGQFVLCALLLAKAELSSIALTVFLTNLRHFLMNLHTATLFPKASLLQQLLIGSFMTDESYSVLLGAELKNGLTTVSPMWMYGNNFASYLVWCLSTVLGAVLGNLLPNPAVLGIDFALIAMFVAIFTGQLTSLVNRLPFKKIGVLLAVVTVTYLTSSMVITGSLAVLLATITACTVGVMIDD